MPSGCQFWDANGVIIFDIDDQTVKFFDKAIVGNSGIDSATGTITDARFTAYSGHTPFYAELEGGRGSNAELAPQWTFSGNNLNWSFPNPNVRPRVQIIYGIVGNVY